MISLHQHQRCRSPSNIRSAPSSRKFGVRLKRGNLSPTYWLKKLSNAFVVTGIVQKSPLPRRVSLPTLGPSVKNVNAQWLHLKDLE